MKATLLNLRKTKMAKASVLLFMILMLSLSTALAQFTWTTSQTGCDQTWISVTYGNGVFVAVGNDGMMYSPDGTACKTTSSTGCWKLTAI